MVASLGNKFANDWEFVKGELYEMDFNEDVTDTYTLLVNFPKQYATDTTYADVTENISIIIESKQIL